MPDLHFPSGASLPVLSGFCRFLSFKNGSVFAGILGGGKLDICIQSPVVPPETIFSCILASEVIRMGVETWKRLRCGGQGRMETLNPALPRTPVWDQGCSSVGRDWASMQETVPSTPDTTKTARPQSQYPGDRDRRIKRSRTSSTKYQVQGHPGLCLKTNKNQGGGSVGEVFAPEA